MLAYTQAPTTNKISFRMVRERMMKKYIGQLGRLTVRKIKLLVNGSCLATWLRNYLRMLVLRGLYSTLAPDYILQILSDCFCLSNHTQTKYERTKNCNITCYKICITIYWINSINIFSKLFDAWRTALLAQSRHVHVGTMSNSINALQSYK